MIINDNLTKYNRINFDRFFFFINYIPWAFAWMLSSSLLKDFLHPYAVINTFNYIGIPLIIISILSKRKIEYVFFTKIIFLLIISAIVSYNNDNAAFVFISVVFMFLARDVDLNSIVKVTMWLQIAGVIMTVGASLLGIIPDSLMTQSFNGTLRYRHAFGYTFTTFLPNYFLSIVMEYIYLSKKSRQVNLPFLMTSIILNVVIYKYTDTRMTYNVCWLALLGYVLLHSRRIRKSKKASLSSFQGIYVYLAIISLLLAKFYNPNSQLMSKMNDALTQRLRFASQGLANWGLSLFGQSIVWKEDTINYNYIDNSFVNIAICYGVIILLVVVVGFTIALKKSISDRDTFLTLVLILWAIKAFVDPQLFLLWFNPFLFSMGDALFETRKERLPSVIHNMCV
ncbi:hypothetical protein VSS55_04995 [Lactobacillus delbrueckii subsp. allosunkii]|uniref:hypothetical protein n=1 Tax=Lactobacillus delbrueckii TaxID=1584 RepID=UPI0001DC99B1|nr:hypothetical protein [Lactobacillus delbrueckii]EFK31173.1 hypothetical protein HMPREF9264_0739 [Lactobacillus delbrueckii subsp. bulgaricus PB2003/044-T3-4]